jgi:N-acetylglutamate synthase-like GNAT family acetyltransferase
MAFKIIRADARHRRDINRLIASANIGPPLRGPIKRETFIVRAGGRAVGFAGMDFVGDRAAILHGIAVEREYRHRGIGSALIRHRINIARARGIHTVAFVTMYYHFNFYKRRGFRTCPRKDLPEPLKSYRMFISPRYMKCAVMVGQFYEPLVEAAPS